MEERHLTVPRTARYYIAGRADGDTRQVWFGCHGYGQLAASFLRSLAPLDDGRRYLVVPEGLSRFYLDGAGGRVQPARVGASWMTREQREHEIADYVRYLDLLYDEVFRTVERARVTVHVLGFSQGTATASRWLTGGRAAADRLILWGGPLPADLDVESARRVFARTELVLVHGARDEYLDAAAGAEEEARLRGLGIACRRIVFDGGHAIAAPTLRALAGA